MSSYKIEFTTIIAAPAVLNVSDLKHPLTISSCIFCQIQKNQGGCGIIFININNNIEFKNSIIDRCTFEDDQGKLIDLRCSEGYSLFLSRSSISQCSNNRHTLQHKTIMILAIFYIEDLNCTSNCAKYDSILSLVPKETSQTNAVKRIKAIDCYSRHIGIYSLCTNATLHNIVLINNDVEQNSIFYQENGSAIIYESNFINNSATKLFSGYNCTVKVYRSYIEHQGVTTGEGCEILDQVNDKINITLGKPNINFCALLSPAHGKASLKISFIFLAIIK